MNKLNNSGLKIHPCLTPRPYENESVLFLFSLKVQEHFLIKRLD